LVKPFSARELVARINTHLELSKLRAQQKEQSDDVTSLLSQVPTAFAVLRGKELVYEIANPAYLEIVGRSDILGKPFLDALPELRGSGYDEILRGVLETGKPWIAKDLLAPLDRDGDGVPETTYFSFVIQPVRGRDGVIDRVMAVAADVTDQRLSQQRAEEANERLARGQAGLERAAALRDEFLTVASHELRTPLTTLGLQLDGLVRSLEEHPGDAGARSLRRAKAAREEADRLEALIEAMIEMFQLGREGIVLAPEETDLAEVARRVVQRFTSQSKRSRHQIELSAKQVVGHWDVRRLEQIITQLVSNGVKFGGGNTVRVLVDGDETSGGIAVMDAGIGIPEEEHERIFERFERTASARDYGGFGLGLWVVRELVAAMGGTVRVDSEPGRGATFVVELPRRQ
jgi:signal transduction histidine kinase